MSEEIKLIRGDCMKELGKMDDKSVDVVFYDPPYNVGKKYDGYDDKLPEEDYLEWMRQVYAESDRVSRQGVIAYIGGTLVNNFSTVFPRTSHLIIVHKRAAGVFAGGYMLQYHGMYSTVKPLIKCKDLWDDVRLPGEGYFFREPRYDTPGLTGLALTQKVLYYFTKEGDTVLDPFVGTGTTAVAARLMGRSCIGIEQSKKYLTIARGRLKDIEEALS